MDPLAQRIEEELTEVFHAVFDDDLVITRDLTADKIEEWDSATHVRLLLTVERKFQIRFTPPEVARLKTVGDLIDLIEQRCRGRAPSN
jgi:acyl carrier protein